MIDHLAYQISEKKEEIAGLYYKLILLVTDPETNNSINFDLLAHQLQSSAVNINLELSQLMLSLTPRQRSLKSASLLGAIIKDVPKDTVLLNNIHILFDPLLRQDPLRLLQNLSRHKTIIAVWEGQVQSQYLTYARPDHPEYRRYPARELVIVTPVSNS